MALTNPVNVTEVQQAFSAIDDTISAAASNDGLLRDQTRYIHRTSLLAGGALSLRTVTWTQTDDQEVRGAYLRVTDTAAGATVTWTLTVEGDDTRFLLDHTLSITVAAINGTVDSRIDRRTTTGDRLRLKKGVRYRMTITVAGADVGVVMAGVQLRTKRRTR